MKHTLYRKLSAERDRPTFPPDQVEHWSDSKLVECIREVNQGFQNRPPVEELCRRFMELKRGRP